jgi:hypothetical protein
VKYQEASKEKLEKDSQESRKEDHKVSKESLQDKDRAEIDVHAHGTKGRNTDRMTLTSLVKTC